jgi:hypothetical protein
MNLSVYLRALASVFHFGNSEFSNQDSEISSHACPQKAFAHPDAGG